MYSGALIRPMRRFDAWFGAHQKIDRVARQHLTQVLLSQESFPAQKDILRFEGIDGPDGIKLKTPAQGELWHFIDPDNEADRQLLDILSYNYQELVKALKSGNETRAAFEAAWLAHGIVDGLTPAHHYPYEDELMRLRGEGIETRVTPKDKLFITGETIPDSVSKNWQVWGDKGLIATHFAFEWGIAAMVTPLRFSKNIPAEAELDVAIQKGLSETFLACAKDIAALKMYDQFYKSGWTPKLAKQARRELLPRIINMVTIAWYLAAQEAHSA